MNSIRSITTLAVVAAVAAPAPTAVAEDEPVPSGGKCTFKVKKRHSLERVLKRGLHVKVSCDGPASVSVMAGFANAEQNNDWIDLHPGGVPGIASCEDAELWRAGRTRLTCKGFPKRFMRRYKRTTLEVFFGREAPDRPGIYSSVGGRDVVLVR